MPSITPVYSHATLHTFGTVARNAVARDELDLQAKWGAFVLARLGRGGTAALTNGVDLLAQRMVGNSAENHPGQVYAFRSDTVAAIATTCAASGNDAGVGSLTVASTTSYAVGDLISFGAGADGDTEWNRVSRITDATHLLLTSPTKFAHNDVGHFVRNKAEAWSFWLPGGAVYEVICDFGDDASGDSVHYESKVQTFDSILSA